MNGIDNRSNVYAKRLMRLKLAELNELVRLGEGIPGDEQRIEMIKGLLGQWHMDVPVEESARWRRKTYMDTNTLLIIIVLVLLLGGGWYGRGRWF